MFEKLSEEPLWFQDLFKKIMRYHFDWSPTEPTPKTRVKQVREWVELASRESQENGK